LQALDLLYWADQITEKNIAEYFYILMQTWVSGKEVSIQLPIIKGNNRLTVIGGAACLEKKIIYSYLLVY
jgi:hypothetical protein